MSGTQPSPDIGTTLRRLQAPITTPGGLELSIKRCNQTAGSLLTMGSPWNLPTSPLPGSFRAHRSLSDPACAPHHLDNIAGGVPEAPVLGNSADDERWIGSERRNVAIGTEAFQLTWCFVGPTTDDPDNPTIIDPQLELAPKGGAIAPVWNWQAPYRDLSPQERRAYLEWNNGGRVGPCPPRPFVLLFVSSLEHAIVRDGLKVSLSEARAALSSLLGCCEADSVSSTAVRRLLTLCEIIDPEFVPTPIDPTFEANFRDQMPFGVRHFLGWMLKDGGRLEADGGLLFYLQQPRRHLEPHEIHYFRELLACWCLRYPEACRDAFPDPAGLPRLALDYEPLVGSFGRSFTSSLPDPGVLKVPTALEVLFRECSEPLRHLRHEPVGRILTNVPVPAIMQESRAPTLDWRVGPATQLAALVADSTSRAVPVAELLSALLEAPQASAKKLLPQPLAREVSRRLDVEGFGFEPDYRSGFPPSLRLDRRVTLFRTGRCDHQKPSEPFLLAQAAVVVSSLAQLWFPSLKPLALDEVEERLPFRHRFRDGDYARLQATAVAIGTLDERPRIFVGRWIKRLARSRRIDQLVTGFGMAFRGQRRNGDLERLARSLLVECQSLISVEDMLAATADAVIPDECFHRTLESRVEALQPAPADASPAVVSMALTGREDVQGLPSAPFHDVPIKLEGLEGRHAELLLALHDRPRTQAELGELARSRRLSLAAAVARINEWALLSLDADAISEDEQFMLSIAARRFLDQQMDRNDAG